MAPLYARIEQDLLRQIESGELTAGEAIPTEYELCRLYGVSRITVRRAVERLVAARLIYRRRGAGTFVSRREVSGRSLRLVGRMDEALSFQQALASRVLERGLVVPPREVREAFAIARGRKAYLIASINFLDGEPYALTRAYFAPDLSGPAARIEPADGQTTVQAIERLAGVRARSAHQSISAAVADARLARPLGIAAGRAVLTAQRTYYSDRPTPIEVVLATYHPTRYTVSIELVGADSAIDLRPKPMRKAPDGGGRGDGLSPARRRTRKSPAPLAVARKAR